MTIPLVLATVGSFTPYEVKMKHVTECNNHLVNSDGITYYTSMSSDEKDYGTNRCSRAQIVVYFRCTNVELSVRILPRRLQSKVEEQPVNDDAML